MIEAALISKRDAAIYMGLSVAKIYMLCAEGKLKPVNFGKSSRLRKSDIDKLIEETQAA